jgi:hypothetical protein
MSDATKGERDECRKIYGNSRAQQAAELDFMCSAFPLAAFERCVSLRRRVTSVEVA